IYLGLSHRIGIACRCQRLRHPAPQPPADSELKSALTEARLSFMTPAFSPRYVIRQAVSSDIPVLKVLIEQSVRTLQKNDYTTEQIEGALGHALGLDTQLIDDGTYFVAEAAGHSAIVGCGGWSNRAT